MISTHPLGRGPAVADYYLTRRECDDLGYYVGRHQPRVGGSGAALPRSACVTTSGRATATCCAGSSLAGASTALR